MRDVFQIDRGAEVWAVRQDVDDAAVVGLEELFKHQAGEQLMLREFLGAEAVGIRWQRLLGRGVCHQQHPPWRLAGCAHPVASTTAPVIAQP